MSSDKGTMWIQATVLIVLAGLAYLMVAVYARTFGKAAAIVQNLDAGENPVDNGPPGAPTREQITKLHDTLRKKLGVNARGLPRVAHVDYDGWPDRLLVVFPLDRAPADMTAVRAADLAPMLDVLRAVHAGGLRWRWVLLSGTAPVEVGGASLSESTVVRAVFSREKLDRADWSTLTAEMLPRLAEQFSVESELAELHPGGARSSSTQPAITSQING